MRKGTWAANKDGVLEMCYSLPENMGKGRCPHVAHMQENESYEEFLDRVNELIELQEQCGDKEELVEISNKDQSFYAKMKGKELDEIFGQKVTMENFQELYYELPIEKKHEVAQLCFDASEHFSLPIEGLDDDGNDLTDQMYFANMYKRGIGGKATAINQLFREVGNVPSFDGSVEIKGNYKDGLTPDQYFDKMFSTRMAAMSKTVDVAMPGWTNKKLFYGLSHIQVKSDCGGDHSKGILGCKIPDGVCEKCAAVSGATKWKKGMFIGAKATAALASDLVQLSMREFHSIWEDQPLKVKRHGFLMNILWKDLECGDIFDDDSICTEIRPWEYKKCIKLTTENQVMIVSEDHMFKVKMADPKVQLNLEHSRMIRIRTDIPEDDIEWVTAKDIMRYREEMEIWSIAGERLVYILEAIPHGDEELKVRCITTNKGYYLTGDFTSHNTGGKDLAENKRKRECIIHTLDAWKSSDIIQKALQGKTTEEIRQIMADEMDKEYKNQGIKIDRWNIDMVCKVMTSYNKHFEPVKDGELCTIKAIKSVGDHNNPFNKAVLSNGYNMFTKPEKHKIHDSASNKMLF